MQKLEHLRSEVNRAYNEVLECRCYIKKRQLLKRFHEKNKIYNQHKSWVSSLALNS